MPSNENINNVEFSKEKIQNTINEATDYQELYDNALKILEQMEKELGNRKEQEREAEISQNTGLDGILNTKNPRNVFETKAKALLERSKDIAEKTTVKNAIIQLGKSIGIERLDERSKQIITDELKATREAGKNSFKNELENKKTQALIQEGKDKGIALFSQGAILEDMKGLKNMIQDMNTNDLILSTFNIENGSSAYELCYSTIKTRLKGENLFNYIEKQPTKDALQYSAVNSLLSKRKSNDLYQRLKTSRNEKAIYHDIESRLFKDKDLTTSFLSSIDDIKSNPEMNEYFQSILTTIENNPTIKQAYKNIRSIDNADIFKTGKIEGLMLYDNDGHGGGGEFFNKEYEMYRNQGYEVIPPAEKDSGHTKYVLHKGNTTITMIKINTKNAITAKYINDLVGTTDYNLFTMRGHCHNTKMMVSVLGNRITEDAILIDGGCRNALHTGEYYQDDGVKGHIFAYTGEGRGNSTYNLTNNIIQAVSQGKNFSDVLQFYNQLKNNKGDAGYFASHSERPDSLVSQYKRLTANK